MSEVTTAQLKLDHDTLKASGAACYAEAKPALLRPTCATRGGVR